MACVSSYVDWKCGRTLAQTARDNNVSNPCVVIPHNRTLPNSAQFSGERNSFHSMTGNGTPYCYTLVFTENLTIADPGHFYAADPSATTRDHTVGTAKNSEPPDSAQARA